MNLNSSKRFSNETLDQTINKIVHQQLNNSDKYLNQKSHTEYTSNAQIIILLSDLQKELRTLQKNLDKEWNYIKQAIDFIEECKKELLRK